jgi:hypothetical protein
MLRKSMAALELVEAVWASASLRLMGVRLEVHIETSARFEEFSVHSY